MLSASHPARRAKKLINTTNEIVYYADQFHPKLY